MHANQKMANNRDETALLCGGTAGIGLASARALLSAGTKKIMLVGRKPARGTAAQAALAAEFPGADIRFFAADLGQPDGAEAAVQACLDAFGRIDTLLSCAGGDPMPRLLHETPLAELPRIIGGTSASVLLPVRAALPAMMAQRSGNIICIASDAAKVATPGEVCIGAAMAAIVMFCRALAIEAKRSGIRVNCLTPSIVRDTPLYDALMQDAFAGKLFAKAENLAKLGVVVPEDLAALVLFLSSPAAARLTGQTISVNGGISAA
ncbi:SDR family NAD(P)-dependent oxidoreductase [Ferrovibrio sp.]|uniref:SDR family NAD(P)-dependent oxidoreductase n=1 Tax=Ferrovibrio sp. TaxID=1917215 RepID=UPI003D0F440C